MFTVHLVYELSDTAFKINMVDPGYTKTDFTNYNGGKVKEAGKRVAKYALIGKEGPTGKFFSEKQMRKLAKSVGKRKPKDCYKQSTVVISSLIFFCKSYLTF